jgi:hypothetical protein
MSAILRVLKQRLKNLGSLIGFGETGRNQEGGPQMPKQAAFPGLRDTMKKKRTRRQTLLAEMETLVASTRLTGNDRAA